jgi:N-acetylglucosamine kinase-like BadF-type ATPase
VLDASGKLRGFGRAGPSNWEGVGLEGARVALGQALAGATESAHVRPVQVEGAVFGLGGVDWPSDVDRLVPVIESLGLSGAYSLVNDSFIALRAGTDLPLGVAIVAGSGTTVAGRNRGGESYRTLGQGPPLFDDFGSAPDVAERAVQAVARAFTGRGPETILSQRLCEATGTRSVAELLEGLSRGAIAVPPAAPIVLAEAEAGDVAARGIVLEAGSALGKSAAVAIRRLGMEAEVFEVVLAGGLFRGLIPILWDAIFDPVHAVAPRADLVRLSSPPVVGAGLMALELVGESPAARVRESLSEECSAAAALAERAPRG